MNIKNLSHLIGVLCWGVATAAWGQGVTPGEVRAYSTPQSIGIEWDVTGDGNHNAEVEVQYSVQGSEDWRQAFPLFRVDHDSINKLAGSIFFLRSATSYDVQLELTDPDGGGTTRRVTVQTGPIPRLPEEGPTYHVIPGSGGGAGTDDDPYRGIAEAQRNATFGDTFLLRPGDYGGPITFDRGGTGDEYVAWVATGDEPVHFNGVRVEANRIWIEGFSITLDTNALKGGGGTSGVVVRSNTITGCNYCIHLSDGDEGWWISDNTIVGDRVASSGKLDGEGIELQHTSGHTVAYNRISAVADGISYPHRNVDIFGNDIFETSDDGIEPDYGFENVRVWGNRIHHAHNNGITFQPMNSGPWYILFNQVIGSTESVLKLREVTHAFVAHNTFVGWTRVIQSGAGWLRNMMTRNNIFISITGDYIIEDTGSSGVADNWRTDLDNDGFAWGDTTNPIFKWHGTRYKDLAEFRTASGQETVGKHLPISCFETLNVPGAPPTVIPPQWITLAKDCNAVDAGEVLPNINDGFIGLRPDLGAHERGSIAHHYGPRDDPDDPDAGDAGPGDAGPGDAGSQPDGGGPDAGVPDDGSTNDSGPGGIEPSDGCGCAAPAGEATGWAFLLVAVLLFTLNTRRRR